MGSDRFPLPENESKGQARGWIIENTKDRGSGPPALKAGIRFSYLRAQERPFRGADSIAAPR